MEDIELNSQINNIINSQDFINNSSPFGFATNVFIVCFLAYILGIFYNKYGRSLSNRASLASNFPLLALATMAIITVVKSSLALSLGLVGALSIVRFRTPIKEPEELIYLFICIALGLSVGADQRIIAILILISTIILVLITNRSKLTNKSKSGFFTIFINSQNKFDEDSVIEIIKIHSDKVIVNRFSANLDSGETDICLDIAINSFDSIVKIKKDLLKISKEINLEIVDSSKIVGSI